MKKSMSDVGLRVWGEFSLALEKAGFTPEMVYGVINSKDNKVAIKLREIASEEIESDDEYFHLSGSFVFKTPDDYEHSLTFFQNAGCAPSVDGSRRPEEKQFETSEAFLPGKKHIAEVYTLLKTAELHRINLFLDKQKPIRAGLPGLLWVLKENPPILPVEKLVISFGLPTEDYQSIFTPNKNGEDWGRLGILPTERIGRETCLLLIKEA